jgi:soluble lytic murein transglycosylase-like protein
MRRDANLLLLLAGAALAYEYYKSATSGDPTSFASNPLSSIMETVTPWKSAGSGPRWVPVLNAVEQQFGIPTDLLARLAYQESRFREDVIRGTTPSGAGALGMMQMLPQYFDSVNTPIPYSDAAVTAQISQAAQNLVSLYNKFGSWPLALAGYNAGAGNVEKYGGIPPFPETQNYVAEITADVPVPA